MGTILVLTGFFLSPHALLLLRTPSPTPVPSFWPLGRPPCHAPSLGLLSLPTSRLPAWPALCPLLFYWPCGCRLGPCPKWSCDEGPQARPEPPFLSAGGFPGCPGGAGPRGRTPTPPQQGWHFLPPTPVCQVGTGRELVRVPRIPGVGSLQGSLSEGAPCVARESWRVVESPSLQGPSGATCSAIPEWCM